MSSPACILALDIGSSSVRSSLYDGALSAVAGAPVAARPYGWSMEDGGMETDAALLIDRVASVVDEGVAFAASEGFSIEAVAIATFWHSLVGLGESGAAVTPLYGWGDNRCSSAAEPLRRQIEADGYHRRTGCFLSAVYPTAKLAWLRRRDADRFSEVAHWASFGDHLEQRLFGHLRTSHSAASATGLLDVRTLAWDSEVLTALGLTASRLPDLVDLEPIHGLGPEWRKRWPALQDVPWFPAIGDGVCANIGSGAIGSERVGLTVGTSAAVRVLRPAGAEDAPSGLWDYRLDRSHRVAGGALSNGGNGLAFLRRTFPALDLQDLDRALATAPPGSHGLTVHPALVDERMAERGGSGAGILGLRPTTEPLDIARSWLEAIARRVLEPFRMLEGEFGLAVEVRASGGAFAVLPGWLQTFADVLDRPVLMSRDPEATSRGAALIVARELGWIESLAAAPPVETALFEPRPEAHRMHQQAATRGARFGIALKQV